MRAPGLQSGIAQPEELRLRKLRSGEVPASGVRVPDHLAGLHADPRVSDQPIRLSFFSPDGSRLATAPDGESLHLHTLHGPGSTNRLELRHRGNDKVLKGAFDPTGRFIATATQDGQLHLWDAHSGEPAGPSQPVGGTTSVAFSPDVTRLATRTLAGSVHLWDAATGTPLIPSHVLSGTATSMAFLDATQTFLVVTGDGVLHRWHCVPTPESTEELSRLSDALNGVPPTR